MEAKRRLSYPMRCLSFHIALSHDFKRKRLAMSKIIPTFAKEKTFNAYENHYIEQRN